MSAAYPGFGAERVHGDGGACAHALRAAPSPAASRAGWPLTPHASSTRDTFATALRPPSPVLLQSPVLTSTHSALFLPGLACAMSGIGSIPGAAGGNPVVFFDISIGGHSAGRIKMEVRCDPRPRSITPAREHQLVPRTCMRAQLRSAP